MTFTTKKNKSLYHKKWGSKKKNISSIMFFTRWCCWQVGWLAGNYRILPQLMPLPAQDELNLSEIHSPVFSNAAAVPHINSIFNIKHLICFRLPLSGWFYFCLYQNSFSLSFSHTRQITFYFLNHWQWFRKINTFFFMWICSNLKNWITTPL